MSKDIARIDFEITELNTQIATLNDQKSTLLSAKKAIEDNFAELAAPVGERLKGLFEKAHPSLLADDDRRGIASRTGVEVKFHPTDLGHTLKREVNENASEEIEWVIVEGSDPYDEGYLELDSKYDYDFECATIVGIAALFPSGVVSVFQPLPEDTVEQARQRAKRWRKKREGARFFGYRFNYHIIDDDGSVIDIRHLAVYPTA